MDGEAPDGLFYFDFPEIRRRETSCCDQKFCRECGKIISSDKRAVDHGTNKIRIAPFPFFIRHLKEFRPHLFRFRIQEQQKCVHQVARVKGKIPEECVPELRQRRIFGSDISPPGVRIVFLNDLIERQDFRADIKQAGFWSWTLVFQVCFQKIGKVSQKTHYNF